MQKHKLDLLIFDLDGTLIESKWDIATAVNLTLVDLGLPQRSQLIPCATLRWRGHYFAEPGPVLDGPCVLVDRSLKIGNSPVAEAGFDLPARSSYDAAQRIVFGAKEGAISGD